MSSEIEVNFYELGYEMGAKHPYIRTEDPCLDFPPHNATLRSGEDDQHYEAGFNAAQYERITPWMIQNFHHSLRPAGY